MHICAVFLHACACTWACWLFIQSPSLVLLTRVMSPLSLLLWTNNGLRCIAQVFEKLGPSLYDFLRRNEYQPLPLALVQVRKMGVGVP